MRPKGKRPAWTKQISRWEEPRGADEVVVAVTLWDNITRERATDLWAGVPDRLIRMPLGRKARYGETRTKQLLVRVRSEPKRGLVLRIRRWSGWSMRVSRLIHPPRPKVAADCQLEAVLGKTRRTEF